VEGRTPEAHVGRGKRDTGDMRPQSLRRRGDSGTARPAEERSLGRGLAGVGDRGPREVEARGPGPRAGRRSRVLTQAPRTATARRLASTPRMAAAPRVTLPLRSAPCPSGPARPGRRRSAARGWGWARRARKAGRCRRNPRAALGCSGSPRSQGQCF
jgi:hypothetical protein